MGGDLGLSGGAWSGAATPPCQKRVGWDGMGWDGRLQAKVLSCREEVLGQTTEVVTVSWPVNV